MDPESDYYGALGVPVDASEEDIRRGYLAMASKWHPDRPELQGDIGAHDRMTLINEAWEVLGSSASRAKYDWARNAASTIRPRVSSPVVDFGTLQVGQPAVRIGIEIRPDPPVGMPSEMVRWSPMSGDFWSIGEVTRPNREVVGIWTFEGAVPSPLMPGLYSDTARIYFGVEYVEVTLVATVAAPPRHEPTPSDLPASSVPAAWPTLRVPATRSRSRPVLGSTVLVAGLLSPVVPFVIMWLALGRHISGSSRAADIAGIPCLCFLVLAIFVLVPAALGKAGELWSGDT